MIAVETAILLLTIHCVADFVFQTDWMAVNKSKHADALLLHTLVYTAPFVPLFGWKFALATWVLHTVTDFWTSRASSAMWQRNERHWFFVVIGIDQWIHAVSLILTYTWLTT